MKITKWELIPGHFPRVPWRIHQRFRSTVTAALLSKPLSSLVWIVPVIVSGLAAFSLAFSSIWSHRSRQIILASAQSVSVVFCGSWNKSPKPYSAPRSPLLTFLMPPSYYCLPCMPRSDRPPSCLRAFALANPSVWNYLSRDTYITLPQTSCSYVSLLVRLLWPPYLKFNPLPHTYLI